MKAVLLTLPFALLVFASLTAQDRTGAWSPPRASTATRVVTWVASLRRGRSQRPDLASAIRLARRADAMRLLRRAALLARRDARRGDAVLRATLVAPRLRGLSLRNGH